MSNWPFRFVHSGDFHLELPPHGVAEVPDHLRELFLEAPYLAATKVFDTVLAEEAELLILSGDLLHPPHTGPRGPLFLAEQFARLDARGIAVYWAGGRVDPPELWPSGVKLPANVRRFPPGRIEQIVHSRDDVPLLRLLGASRDRRRKVRARDFKPDAGGLLSIAVVHGNAQAERLKDRGIHYWALGGRHDRDTLLSSPQVAHSPGSPQGRSPREPGAHGCTLVHIDPEHPPRTSFVPTDVARWVNERIIVDEQTKRDTLDGTLRDRMQQLTETHASIDLLISWTIGGTGPLMGPLRRGGLRQELLDWLRGQYGFGPPAAWSVEIDVEPPVELPEPWYDQETIRGDYLRMIRQWDVEEPLDLAAYVPERYQAGTFGASLLLPEGTQRHRVLREAALLGAELLSGEEEPT